MEFINNLKILFKGTKKIFPTIKITIKHAKSIITDADIASEASKFTQQQILQQVSTSLLAQANQAPSIALSLV